MRSPTSSASARPTPPASRCPRCEGQRVLALVVHTGSTFEWYECEECGYLWAMPHGWSPHGGPGGSSGD